MNVMGTGRSGFWRKLSAAGLCCLASAACGQTADTSKVDPPASGGATATATNTGGQNDASGGVPARASGGSDSVLSGGSPAAGGFSTGGVVVGGASGGETVGSNGVAPHPAKGCVAPTESLLGGGFVVCEDGSYRRPRAAACALTVPTGDETEFGCHPEDECCANSDCVKAPYGYCQYGACFYGCVSDADCDSGSVCHCGNPMGICLAAACRSDADCPADFPCSEAYFRRELACQAPTDACLTDRDCGGTQARCGPTPEGRSCIFSPG